MASRQAARRLLNLSSVLRRSTLLTSVRITSPMQKSQPARCLKLQAASFHSSSKLNNNSIINIQDEEDFKKRVIESDTPVVVDFHASWCGPCKMLGPRLESMISAKSGAVILAKVDIDENSDLAMNHGVQAVPTVLAIKGGQVVDKFVGMKDDDSLQSFIDALQS